MKPKKWRGKLNHEENICPHCGTEDQYSDVTITVMELSAQHYKLCTQCQGHFVDTYLITFDDDESEDNWQKQRPFDDKDQDHAELFQGLMKDGYLSYDDDNPDEDGDYYDLIPDSIHFIKGEDNG